MARHESLLAQLRVAAAGLHEASLLLQQQNVESRPTIMALVETAVALANARVKAVADALERFGPDAMLFD